MSSSKVDILQMNESTVLDDDVYIPGFKKVRKIGQLTEGTEVVYVQTVSYTHLTLPTSDLV